MNEITMKMQADQLIRMALQEDITSEDVSTNAVMRSAVKGTVDLIAKEDGIIAGLDVYARVFQILDEKTEINFNFKDGDAVKKGDLVLEVDLDKVKAAGYDTSTLVVICNTDDYGDVRGLDNKEVQPGDDVIVITK